MSRPANRITVSRSKRGTTIKASGSAAQALFDALTKPTTPKQLDAAEVAEKLRGPAPTDTTPPP